MGFRISWIARRGASRAELLSTAGCTLTGERGEFVETGFYLLDCPADGDAWVLLLASGSDNFAELREDMALALSRSGAEVLYFWCSDTTMASELVSFRNGSLVWSIRYDCEDASKRPELAGAIPAQVHAELTGLREQQAADRDDEVDYIYELTANVARTLVGFRHDEDPETDEADPFHVLAR